MVRARNPKGREFVLPNAIYWFENELRRYPAVERDFEILKAHADQIVQLVGRESRCCPAYQVNVELGKKLGRDFIELPGGHIGYVTQPAEFARAFVQALAQT